MGAAGASGVVSNAGAGGTFGAAGADPVAGSAGVGGAGAAGMAGASAECDGATAFCDPQCVDLTVEVDHCGACDRVCSSANVQSRLCTAGLCASECQLGWGDCARPDAPSDDDGCETDLQSDPTNCGQCGSACEYGDCVAGQCSCGAEGPSCVSGLDCSGESCCMSLLVPGGSFDRGGDMRYPATVSDFCLDKYEVTVGRFRKFVQAYEAGWRPTDGSGAQPVIGPSSGWSSAWNGVLPSTGTQFKDTGHLKCDSTYSTWTDTALGNEQLPINCANWYEAFAFCAWDGGWLPTEAEWEYAAGGGNENREYPWGAGVDSDHAVYDCCGGGNCGSCIATDIVPVGTRLLGTGRWSHLDLAGSMWEWTMDWYANPYVPATCDDCSHLSPTGSRVGRGGGWYFDASYLPVARRSSFNPTGHTGRIGLRCARLTQ